MAKHKQRFIRDVRFYLMNRHRFTFSGSTAPTFVFDTDGVDGVTAYKILDSHGKNVPTRHPLLASSLAQTKASINFQIKEWAHGVGNYLDCFYDLDLYWQSIGAPSWVHDAVLNTVFANDPSFGDSNTFSRTFVR